MASEGESKRVDYLKLAGSSLIRTASLVVEWLDEAERDQALDSLKKIALKYAYLDIHHKMMLDAIDETRRETSADDDVNIDTLLEQKLKGNISDDQLRKHTFCKQFENGVKEITKKQDDSMQDEDLVMTQEKPSTIDPFLQKEMKDPVKNTKCGHSYEKTSVESMMKARKDRGLRCPIVGCKNQDPITEADLVEDIELKRYINSQQR